MADDFELLREYVERGSEDAFRTLVERHAAMVYGTALRVTRDNALAEEVTQTAFILLARKAARLRPGTVVAGWLYRTARFVVSQAIRTEQRRRQRHEILSEMNDAPDSAWKEISPLLEEAMDRLGSVERTAVVLRFFEGKTFAEVATALGTTEPAAKMRVGRAREKLRHAFASNGVVLSAAVLSSALSAHAAPIVPAGLVASTVAAAFAPHAVTNASLTTLVKGALKVMAWNKAKSTAIATVIVLLLGGGATFVALKHQRAGARLLIVATLEPMAGDWEGTFVMSGNGLTEPVKQTAALSIRTAQQGRSCEIEMRVLAPGGGVARVCHFTHSITKAGDRIVTLDDPTVGRLAGEGVVTVSTHDKRTGDWRAAFRAALPDGRGSTDCEWIRKGDELTIVRHDRDEGTGRAGEGISELRLRKAFGDRPTL